MMSRLLRVAIVSVVLSAGGASSASTPGGERDSSFLIEEIKSEISKNYGQARIELRDPIQWSHGKIAQPLKVTFLGDNGRGDSRVAVNGKGRYSEAWVHFDAWTLARVAQKRIRPGDQLTAENFTLQSINVAQGPHREFRGVMLADTVRIEELEATQTILEGQVLLSSAVQKIPDIRRGDSVRIHLTSGGLTVTTLGTAQEPSYVNRRVRVLTAKGKREFLGYLQPDGVVEVRL